MGKSDFEVVENYLKEKGKTNYKLEEGDGCVWAIVGRTHMYFFLREGKIVDVQVD